MKVIKILYYSSIREERSDGEERSDELEVFLRRDGGHVVVAAPLLVIAL